MASSTSINIKLWAGILFFYIITIIFFLIPLILDWIFRNAAGFVIAGATDENFRLFVENYPEMFRNGSIVAFYKENQWLHDVGMACWGIAIFFTWSVGVNARARSWKPGITRWQKFRTYNVFMVQLLPFLVGVPMVASVFFFDVFQNTERGYVTISDLYIVFIDQTARGIFLDFLEALNLGVLEIFNQEYSASPVSFDTNEKIGLPLLYGFHRFLLGFSLFYIVFIGIKPSGNRRQDLH